MIINFEIKNKYLYCLFFANFSASVIYQMRKIFALTQNTDCYIKFQLENINNLDLIIQ